MIISSECNQQDSKNFTQIMKAAKYSKQILLPLILITGWLGNLMIFRLCQSKLFVKYPIWKIFLKAISIADSLFLLCVFCRWLEAIEIFQINKFLNCGWVLLLIFSSQSISHWLFFILTVYHLMLVFQKHKGQIMFSSKNCRIVIVALCLVFIVLMLHWPFVIYSPNDKNQNVCLYKDFAKKWGAVGWPILYNVFCLAIPLAGSFLCSFILLYSVLTDKSIKDKTEKTLTKIVIGLSLLYNFAWSPYAISQIIFNRAVSKKTCKLQSCWILINILCIILTFLAYSMKFWVIALQTKVIRLNLKEILLRRDLKT